MLIFQGVTKVIFAQLNVDAKNTKKALEHRWTWRPPGWRDMVGWGVTVTLLKISGSEPEQKVKVGKMTSYFCLTDVFFWILGSILGFWGCNLLGMVKNNEKHHCRWMWDLRMHDYVLFLWGVKRMFIRFVHTITSGSQTTLAIYIICPIVQSFLPPQRASLKNVICTPENSHDWPENIIFQYRKYIFKGWIFHCHVDFRGCSKGNSTPRNASIWVGASWYLCRADIQAGAVCCPVPPRKRVTKP